jgi:hypothetical protein
VSIDWTWFLIGLAVGYFGKSAIGSVAGKVKGAVTG